MSMKIAVCDDEILFVNTVRQWLSELPKAFFEVSCFTDGLSLLESPETFDLIFLDIDMPSINGIETAERLRKKDKQVKIIYLTSYTDYLTDAFKVHAFGYLIKPAGKEEILRQIREAAQYSPPSTEGQVLELAGTDGLHRLPADQIFYFEYTSRKIRTVTAQGNFFIKRKIADVAAAMEEYGFAMPHKSFVVNLYHVKSIKGSDLLLTNGETIPLSQKQAAWFRKRLGSYLAERIDRRSL